MGDMHEPGKSLDKGRFSPFPIHFEALRDMNSGCVSDRLPILCFEDRAESPDLTRGYLHLDFMSVFVARKGRGVHLVDGVPFEVTAGDVYAMGYGMSHRFADSAELVLDTVHFVPEMFSAETQEALSATEGLAPLFLSYDNAESSRWLRLSPAAHIQAVEMMRDMRQEWQTDGPEGALMVQATFLRFLVFLARSNRRALQSGSRVVAQARAHIELRYADPIKIGDLAASVFLSIGRFTEVFREEVGCSPREYLSRVRIGAAKNLLLESDLSVSAIAARTGFPDPAYFTRFFRHQIGVSPSEFRRGETLASE
ncbi:AraC family transcriptional regulator [bacterium]|nr:MAG: AraC family transcriptional regulator [bacterium]